MNGTNGMPDKYKIANGTTYSYQDRMPRLPIPSLDETLDKFPLMVAALQDEKQRQRTKEIVEQFRNGDGPKLQQMLIEYEEQGRQTGQFGSYVEEFWSDAYLAPDQSVVLNLNPFFVLAEGPDAKVAKDQLRRAASLCYASIKLAWQLKHENLSPDLFKGKPLDMDQFKSLFGSCRVPAKHDKDAVVVYPEATHVLVLSRNQMYFFQALWPDGTVAVDEDDIADILRAIQSSSAEIETHVAAKSALGVLTSLPRGEWATAREELKQSNAGNGESLQIVDSALFVLVLDDFVPKDVDEAAANMLHGTYSLEHIEGMIDIQAGTCCNRWYDKLQIIVCRDGTAGINFEHSSIDGHTALRFVSDIFAETVVNFAQSITQQIHGADRIPHVLDAELRRAVSKLDGKGRPLLDIFPKKLVFDVPASVLDRIYFAETALGDQILACETVITEFRDYGKQLIVSNKMSPDSLVQMSIVLAYYKLYGKIVMTYEPVMTKGFFHGRTEAMRSATPEALKLCQTWTSDKATNEEKLRSLMQATTEHSRLVKESSLGRGVDRHLFALKCIAKRQGLPESPFFMSDAWHTLNHNILSTSNCGNPSLRLFGFGPVVQDGFGIGYIIKDFGIQYAVASKHRQTRRYANMLEQVLREFQSLMKPISKVKVGLSRKNISQLPKHSESFGDIWGESAAPPKSPQAENMKYSRVSFLKSNYRLAGVPVELDLDEIGHLRPRENTI
jgi:carnitine O-acetyltransferase